MSGEILQGSFPDGSQRQVNRAANAIWFARIGVYEVVKNDLVEDPQIDIDAAVERARVQEALALANLTRTEREEAFEQFGWECATLGDQETFDQGIRLSNNVVHAVFGQSR